MEDKKEELDLKDYVINFEIQIIHSGEKIPNKSYVVTPIENFILDRIEKFKHSYRVKRLRITIDEEEEYIIEEEDDEIIDTDTAVIYKLRNKKFEWNIPDFMESEYVFIKINQVLENMTDMLKLYSKKSESVRLLYKKTER